MISKGVPRLVVQDIQNHLIQTSRIGEEGWAHANQDEDTLTGDYFGRLRTGLIRNGNWKWRIKYNKFRGRGHGAYEKTVGADGIITVEIEKNGIRETKSIIFQAKKENNRHIMDQLEKMQRTLPQGNMILIFTERGYFAVTGSDYSNDMNIEQRAGQYLAMVFLECINGQWGVDYDAVKNELRIVGKKIPHANIRHKLEISIAQEN